MTDDAAQLIADLQTTASVRLSQRAAKMLQEQADRIAALTAECEGYEMALRGASQDASRIQRRAEQAEAERDALRAVYNAAVAWRDSDVEEDDQQLESDLVAAIDAARKPKP